MPEQHKISTTALLSLAIPLSSIFGFLYATGYYFEIGCKWATPLLTIQQLIVNSALVSLPFTLSFIITAGVLISGTTYFRVVCLQLGVIGVFLLYLCVGQLTGNFEANPLKVSVCACILSISSSYLARATVTINSSQKRDIGDPLISALLGLSITALTSIFVGQFYAEYQLNKKDKYFPIINDGTYGIERRFISGLGENFLVANMKDGKINNFKIVSDIQNYVISKSISDSSSASSK